MQPSFFALFLKKIFSKAQQTPTLALDSERKGQKEQTCSFRSLHRRKEVNSMELSSSQKETIQHQYDALIKKCLKGETKNHLIELARRAAREMCFSDLSENELSKFFVTDTHKSDYFNFEVGGYDIIVKNDLLGEALGALPDKKRKIILMSYFLDMSDDEIGMLLNVVRSTVFRHRKSALVKIKQYMEGKFNDEHK